jgi:two-component system, NarL family, nitrate/nitrite response regulator NarL
MTSAAIQPPATGFDWMRALGNAEYTNVRGILMVSVVCVVVHPSRLAREGLKATLANSRFDPLCISSSTEEVPSTIASAGEQVVFLMGVREAAHLAQALSAAKASFPDAPVVVIGDSSNQHLVINALAEGATTLIDENVATSALIKELELVAMGEPVISVLLMKRLLGQESVQASRALEQAVAPIKLDQRQQPEHENEARSNPSNPQLSEREAAILKGLIQGNPNKVIAYQLQITEATVKVHVKAILRKIQAKNRTQAATWALRQPDFKARFDNKGDRSLPSATTLVAAPSP